LYEWVKEHFFEIGLAAGVLGTALMMAVVIIDLNLML